MVAARIIPWSLHLHHKQLCFKTRITAAYMTGNLTTYQSMNMKSIPTCNRDMPTLTYSGTVLVADTAAGTAVQAAHASDTQRRTPNALPRNPTHGQGTELHKKASIHMQIYSSRRKQTGKTLTLPIPQTAQVPTNVPQPDHTY